MSEAWDSLSNLLLVQLIYKLGDPYPSETAKIFDQIALQLTNHSLVRPRNLKYTTTVSIPGRLTVALRRTLHSSPGAGIVDERVCSLEWC
jgi:hypothetical protein